MIWQDSDSIAENDHFHFNNHTQTERQQHHAENQKKVKIQLEKYQNPNTDPIRQSLLNTTNKFSEYLLQNDLERIDSELLSSDCEIFVLDSEQDTNVQYSKNLGEGFSSLYKGMKITEKLVLETSVDTLKSTVIQTSKCLMWYNTQFSVEGSVLEKISYEIFSISDHQIYKYRASFALITEAHGSKPFEITPQERMLARVKELNYCIAGTPNLVKLASLLDEKTEYKLWGWDDQKCFVMDKNNLINIFNEVQENKKVVYGVPFDLSVHPSKVIATYVYYLEDQIDINTERPKKYMWISNCIYMFDDHQKIESINQMGEVYEEDEIAIPFEVESREARIADTMKLFTGRKVSFDMFYGAMSSFTTPIYRFGSLNSLSIGNFEGLKDKDQLHVFNERMDKYEREWPTPIDFYLDESHPSYEVICICTSSHFINKEVSDEDKKKIGNNICFMKAYVENNKCCKLLSLVGSIFEEVPSAFDNQGFRSRYIIPKEEFYNNNK